MRLVDGKDLRAWRRPQAIFYFWAWQLAAGWIVAAPIHSWAKSTWGGHPDGDADLFRPGAHALLTWLGSPPLVSILRTTLVLLAIAAVLGQIVTGAIIATLAANDAEGRAPAASSALGTGFAALLPLTLFTAIVTLFEAALIGGGILCAIEVDRSLEASLGEVRAFIVAGGVGAIFAILTLAIGVAGDLARVIVVRSLIAERNIRFLSRIRTGIGATIAIVRRSLGSAMLAWCWRTLLSLALLFVAAKAGDWAGAAAVWPLFAVHQLVIVLRGALRVSWLAHALRVSS